MTDHSTKSKGGNEREWYQKPLGILVLAVAGGILVWLVTNTLQHLFAPAKPVVQVIEGPAKAPVEPQKHRKERDKPKPAAEEDR